MILCQSCVKSLYIPRYNKLEKNEYGSFAKIKTINRDIIKGELISVDSAKVYIINNDISIEKYSLDKSDIRKITVYVAGRNSEITLISGLGTANSILCFSHGIMMIITVPINMLFSLPIAISANSVYKCKYPSDFKWHSLGKFSRYPLGFPKDVAFDDIKK